MKNNKSNHKTTVQKENLIGDESHREYLEVQSEFGIAQRGGVFPFHLIPTHVKRLASDINLLTSLEKKQLIFSGTISNN
ncbi:MAG: hypothetical protein WCH21_08020 [Bacteroidota bacterium]